MFRRFALLLVLLAGAAPAWAAALPDRDQVARIAASDALQRTVGDRRRCYWFQAAGAVMPYRIFVPATWKVGEHLPLIVALHGAGEDENAMFDRGQGVLPRLAERHRMIVVAPLGYNRYGRYGHPWQVMLAYKPTPPRAFSAEEKRIMALSEQDVLNVVERVADEYGVDRSRIYLMGNSMGGAGTWYLGESHRSRWAAIAPSDGPVTPEAYPYARLKGFPVMMIHGSADTVASLPAARDMAARAKKAGVDLDFVIVKGGDHNESWTRVAPRIIRFFERHRKG